MNHSQSLLNTLCAYTIYMRAELSHWYVTLMVNAYTEQSVCTDIYLLSYISGEILMKTCSPFFQKNHKVKVAPKISDKN